MPIPQVLLDIAYDAAQPASGQVGYESLLLALFRLWNACLSVVSPSFLSPPSPPLAACWTCSRLQAVTSRVTRKPCSRRLDASQISVCTMRRCEL